MDNNQRSFLTRIVTGYILAFLLLRFFEHVTPSGLLSPPLGLVQLDITYWTFKLSGLSRLILENRAGSILFDLILFISGIFVLIYPLRRWIIAVFGSFVFLYVIAFNYSAMHHTHMLTGFMVVLFPFLLNGNRRFELAWQAVRYYTCYVYTMAFAWKTVFQHSFFHWQQGIATMKLNTVEYLYHNPDTLLSAWYRICIRNEWIVNTGWIFVVLLEGSMLIGFFTKKFDKVLIWLPVIIHVCTYFFARVFFFEMLVLNISFLSLAQLSRLEQRILSRKPGNKSNNLDKGMFV